LEGYSLIDLTESPFMLCDLFMESCMLLGYFIQYRSGALTLGVLYNMAGE